MDISEEADIKWFISRSKTIKIFKGFCLIQPLGTLVLVVDLAQINDPEVGHMEYRFNQSPFPHKGIAEINYKEGYH